MSSSNSKISKISTGIVACGQYRLRNSSTVFLISSIVMKGALNSLGSIITGLTLSYLFHQFGHLFLCRLLTAQGSEENRKHSYDFMIRHQVFGDDSPVRRCKIEKSIPVVTSGFDAEGFCITFKYLGILRRRHRPTFKATDISRISQRFDAKFSQCDSLSSPKAFEKIPEGLILASHIQEPPSLNLYF